MELGEHLYAFFHSQLLEKEAAMAFWVLAWQKKILMESKFLISKV